MANGLARVGLATELHPHYFSLGFVSDIFDVGLALMDLASICFRVGNYEFDLSLYLIVQMYIDFYT